MRVLITGANGFLGRHVVDAFVRRGHWVRALVRPATKLDEIDWDTGVDVFRADLRHARDVAKAFEGVEALVHLAAVVQGDYEGQFAGTVVTTERLLNAMAQTETKRIVLASSFSVYDWSEITGSLREESPLEADIYTRDAYAASKLWQERLVRRAAEVNGWGLTVLRPALIWGRGHPYTGRVGQGLGRLRLVIGPSSRPPLTYVANCADCFAAATESSQAIDQTLNIVDDVNLNNWRLMGEYLRKEGAGGVRVPVPYAAAAVFIRLTSMVSRLVLGPKAKVPSVMVPCRFEARFKPVQCDLHKLSSILGWRPPMQFRECLNEVYR